MKFVEVRRTISAPTDVVWAILTDAKRLQAENLGIVKIEGDIADGAQIKLWAEVSPDRPFRLTVSEWVPERRMVWIGGMPLGLFRGEREFNLAAVDDDRTDLHIREEFTGLLSGLIWKAMPDLNPSFAQFADGVKAAAEAGAN